MYRCEKCGAVAPKGMAKQSIVVKIPCIHPYRREVNKKIIYEKGKKITKWFDDVGGPGEKIVAEIPVCVKCMNLHNKSKTEQYKKLSLSVN